MTARRSRDSRKGRRPPDLLWSILQSVAEGVIDALKENHALRTIGVEGLREGRWVLIDFGDIDGRQTQPLEIGNQRQ